MRNANTTAKTDHQETGALRLQVFHPTDPNPTIADGLPPGAPAGEIALALAEQLNLPSEVPWTLRADRTAAYLDSDRPIGDQVATDARVTLTPKTHLG